MIVEPQDRDPRSPGALVDRVRAYADWTPADIAEAYHRLFALLGADVRAEGQTNGILVELAKSTRKIRALGGYLRSLDDAELLALPEIVRVISGPGQPRQPRPADPKVLEDVDRRRRQVDAHPLAARALATARATLGDDAAANTARLYREAAQLIADSDWIAEQRLGVAS